MICVQISTGFVTVPPAPPTVMPVLLLVDELPDGADVAAITLGSEVASAVLELSICGMDTVPLAMGRAVVKSSLGGCNRCDPETPAAAETMNCGD